MGRKKLDPLSLGDDVWADPAEIPDDELDEAQEGFAGNVLEAIKAITEDGEPSERIVGVLVSVVSIDKAHPATTEDATRYIAGAACVTPPSWEKYEPPIVAAAAKCAASLATSIIERKVGPIDDLKVDMTEEPYVAPDMVRLNATRIKRVEDLFELFTEHTLDNIPVMFPAVVAHDMFSRAQFDTVPMMFWPIIQHVSETQQMPDVSESMADRLLKSWDDDTCLAIQAMLYVNLNRGPLDELNLGDPLFELCHLVCKQIHDDLETIILGAPDALNA